MSETLSAQDERRALADEIEMSCALAGSSWPRLTLSPTKCFTIIAALRAETARGEEEKHLDLGKTGITRDEMTAAMRTFERFSAVLRYREVDKWHTCDILGMREVLAEFAKSRALPASHEGGGE